MSSTADIFGITNEVREIYTWIVLDVLCQIFNIFGIITNIVNIICFVKQGFDDSVNISLLGLAFSDLGSLVTMFGTCIFFTPALMTADISFVPGEISYLTAGMTHLSFTRVSSCITAMITLERCLCITAPLKIKRIFTRRKSAAIIICVFVTFLFTTAPVYVVNSLGLKYSQLRNRSLVGLISTNERENVEMISFSINSFFIPFSAFIIIVVCTAILSFKLRRQTEWRKAITTNVQEDRITKRNLKTAKLVVMISTLFIVCFIPVTIILLVISFVPEMSLNGDYFSVTLFIAGFGYVMESVNSAMNIFIYYSMSSKYKDIFLHIFKTLCIRVKR